MFKKSDHFSSHGKWNLLESPACPFSNFLKNDHFKKIFTSFSSNQYITYSSNLRECPNRNSLEELVFFLPRLTTDVFSDQLDYIQQVSESTARSPAMLYRSSSQDMNSLTRIICCKINSFSRKLSWDRNVLLLERKEGAQRGFPVTARSHHFVARSGSFQLLFSLRTKHKFKMSSNLTANSIKRALWLEPSIIKLSGSPRIRYLVLSTFNSPMLCELFHNTPW